MNTGAAIRHRLPNRKRIITRDVLILVDLRTFPFIFCRLKCAVVTRDGCSLQHIRVTWWPTFFARLFKSSNAISDAASRRASIAQKYPPPTHRLSAPSELLSALNNSVNTRFLFIRLCSDEMSLLHCARGHSPSGAVH